MSGSPGKDYQLFYHIYGKNGVMGASSRSRRSNRTNCASSSKGWRPTKEIAEEVTLIGCRQIFYARLPEVKGTAGTAAFVDRRRSARGAGLPLDDEPRDPGGRSHGVRPFKEMMIDDQAR